MSKYTSAYARPIQGVSQQTAEARKDGQCVEQINMVPSIVDGLVDRMGTTNVKELMASLHEDSLIYYYDRGVSEEYFIFIEPNSDPVIYTEGGNLMGLTTISGDPDYYQVDNPKEDLALITIADYTFILNKTVGVETTVDTSPAKVYEALVYCQFANYGRDYAITLNGTDVATYSTNTGGTPSDIETIATSAVIDALKTELDTLSATYDSTVIGNSIHIKRTNGSYFTCATSDDADGQDLITLMDTITDTTKLPNKAPDGFVVEVKGESESAPNYYLKSVLQADQTVIWEETIEPGAKYKFEGDTMPHTLIRDSFDVSGVAQFQITQGEWDDRLIGDDVSNPFPVFIDETNPIVLDNIGSFQNRLFVTSQGSAIFTRSGSFFNFFRESTQTKVDTDPFSVYADSDKVQNLHFSDVHEGDLVMFSSESQFIMKGDKTVTYANATLQRVTNYESIDVSPKTSGNSLFFPFNYGGYTGIREFFTDTITEVKEARIITEHVPRYLEGKATGLATSTNKDWLLVFTDADPSYIYVYNWLWASNEKVQSAWHKWSLPNGSEFLFAQFSGEFLYFIIKRPGGIFLEKLSLSDPMGDGLTYKARLDRQQSLTATDMTTGWRMDDLYPDEELDDLVFIRSTGCYDSEIGSDIRVYRDGGYIWTDEILSDDATVNIVMGVKYNVTYEPTEPVMRDGNGRAVRVDELIVSSLLILFEKTGPFVVSVEYLTDTTLDYYYDGRIMGSQDNLIGFAPLQDGDYEVPVMAVSTDYSAIVSKYEHTPIQIQTLEWMGQFTGRGRRV